MRGTWVYLNPPPPPSPPLQSMQNSCLGVLDGHDDASRQLQLLPGLGQIDDVDAVIAPLEHVALHLEVQVLGAQVALGRQHQLDVCDTTLTESY